MTLINCPECNKSVSNTAKQCPNCGYNIKAYIKQQKIQNTNLNENKDEKNAIIFFISVIVVIIIIGIIMFFTTYVKNNTPDSSIKTNSYSDSDNDYEQEYTKPQISVSSLKRAERAAIIRCGRIISVYQEVDSAVYTGNYNIIDKDTVYFDFNMTIYGKTQIKSVCVQRNKNGVWVANLSEYNLD